MSDRAFCVHFDVGATFPAYPTRCPLNFDSGGRAKTSGRRPHLACTGKSALRLKKPFFTSLAYISDAVLALHKRAKLLVESQAAGVAENPYNACTLEKSQARGMLRVSRTIPLRAKFLLSMLAVSAGLTAATLGVVSYHVEKGVRESI